jgi:hypothetical protein
MTPHRGREDWPHGGEHFISGLPIMTPHANGQQAPRPKGTR